MKMFYTTGEVAQICNVSQQTIIRCFDSGQLKGFRVPGSRFRRIPREQLYMFMRDNGIPLDALESLLGKEPPEAPEPQTNIAEELREKWGVETGQLWQLGEHRLICGDCTDADVVARVMGGE